MKILKNVKSCGRCGTNFQYSDSDIRKERLSDKGIHHDTLYGGSYESEESFLYFIHCPYCGSRVYI